MYVLCFFLSSLCLSFLPQDYSYHKNVVFIISAQLYQPDILKNMLLEEV